MHADHRRGRFPAAGELTAKAIYRWPRARYGEPELAWLYLASSCNTSSVTYDYDVSITMSIRVDGGVERELAALAEQAGSRNAAVVAAIHAAYRQHLRDRLIEESTALRDNPEYQAAVQAAREDMGADEAW